jgi:hypothetical protein
MRADRTLDPGLLADALHPLVRTGRRVSGLAGFPALEPPGVDVVAAAKQRPEESNLCRYRRMLARAQTGLLTRTFVGVAVTRQPDHVSTASVRNRLVTLSCKAMRPGCGSRTSSRPWWVPGAYLRASEKSRSWVTRNRPSACAARHTTSSSSPPMASAGTVSTSCPRAVRRGTSPAGRFSSRLIFTARGPPRLADPPALRLRHTR